MGFLVPQSGRIKKIQFRASFEGHKHKINIMLLRGSIFTIIVNKPTEKVSSLVTYECYVIGGDPNTPHNVREKCRFDRNPENIPIWEGDVINKRTDKDYIGDFDFDRGIDRSISYIFAFLIELNPFNI